MEEYNNEGFGFAELTFDLGEEDIADEVWMWGKQYKTLNLNTKMILQFINDFTGDTFSSVSNDEVVSSLKSHESKVKNIVQGPVIELHEKMDNSLKTV